jgi:stage II sporulation protein M
MADLIPGPRQFRKYLYGLRPFIGVVVALFLISMMAGYVIPIYLPDASEALLSGLQGKADALSGQPPLLMMLGIFYNNAVGSLMALLFGLIAGIFPAFFMATNGLVIGIVLETMVSKLGVAGGAAVFMVGILPHGIFELPAVLISAAIGLKLGYAAILSVMKGEDRVTSELKNGLLIFLFWIVPMLFLAAAIETFVTGALLSYVVHAPIFN